MTKLRIRRYSYKAWCIDRWEIPTKGKYKGVGEWAPYKYPGGLSALAHGVLDETLGDAQSVFTPEEAQSIVDTVENCTLAILRALEEHSGIDTSIELEV